MKIDRIILIFFSIILSTPCSSQQSKWRLSVLDGDNTELRRAIVDSVINESFWYEKANYIPWWLLKKEDFTDKSKEKLVSYFNRKMPNDDIENIRHECVKRLLKDSVQTKIKSEKQNISFNLYIEKEAQKDINHLSISAKSEISPLYARLLGWLDYRPAVNIILSVLTDNIFNSQYAQDNQRELIYNCKLALARMGNKEFEEDLINNYFDNIDMNCATSDFYKPFIDLFYINTIETINTALEISDTNTTYKVVFPDPRLELPNCSPREIVKLYLSMVLVDYPLLNPLTNEKFDLYPYPKNADIWLYDEDIINQMNNLNVWLQKNKNSYLINNDRFYYY
jgi:hypothetical protein